MFFLISYGLLNYATYYEARAASPSFRPRFRFFDRRLSLLGTLLCLGAMIAINAVAGLGAILILVAIHQYLRRLDRPQRWADASRSYYFQRAKESIRAMTAEAANPRSWRPQVLAFSADPIRRERLLVFASWLEGESGLTAAVEIVVGEGAIKRKERRQHQSELQTQIERLELDVHGRAVLAPDAMEALPVIVQSFGLGPLKANTVLFGWPENPNEHHLAGYAQAVREIHRLGVNVVSMQSDEQRWGGLQALPRKNRRIDVWWEDDDASRLALLAAYLFTRTGEWSRARIRVLAAVKEDDDRDDVLESLRAILKGARIAAKAECIGTPDVAGIAATSAGSAFVFVPAGLHRGEFVGPYGLATDAVLAKLPSSAAILAGAPFDLVAGPETERHERLRAAEEIVQVAEHRLRTLQSQRGRLEAEVELRRATPETSDDDLAAAERRFETLERRILKAQVKVESARSDLDALLNGDGVPTE
jgi:hypothetical protein